MPLNEAKRKAQRARWPLEFDLEGIPQDTKHRKHLLEIKRSEARTLQQAKETFMSQNSFAVDFLTPQQKQQLLDSLLRETAGGEEIDLSKPKVARYRFAEFPKMVYHHDSGHSLKVKDAAQESAAAKRGYQTKPSNLHDYSKINGQGIAPLKTVMPAVEEQMTAEQLLELDAQEMEAAADYSDSEPTEPEEQTEPEGSDASDTPRRRRNRG